MIEEHPAYFLDEFIYITSAYLQPRRNNGKKGKTPPKRDGFKKSERFDRDQRSHTAAWTGGDRFYRHPKSTAQGFVPANTHQRQSIQQAVNNTKKMSPISPPISPTGQIINNSHTNRPKSISPNMPAAPVLQTPKITTIPKPVFEADVAHLAAKLKQVGMPQSHPFFGQSPPTIQSNHSSQKPKDDILTMDSLFDSGNSSPDDSYMMAHPQPSFQMLNQAAQVHRRDGLYPFGLCLPDYSRGFKTISRCSSFSESKDDLLSGYLENSLPPKLY